MSLEVRSEVIEYGSLPMAPWLGTLDSLQQVRAVTLQLLGSASRDERGRRFATPEAISAGLETTAKQTKVLVDLLAALVEPPGLVHFPQGSEDATGVEVFSLGLYLVVQFYLREAHKADTSDTWPSELFNMQQEPSSPMHMTAKAWGKDQAGSHRAHLPMVRQHLQEHLVLQEALMQGFSGFITSHAHALLALVLNHPPPQDDPHPPPPTAASQQHPHPHHHQQQQQQCQQHQQRKRQPPPEPDGSWPVTAEELDRLGFLLRQQGGGGGGGRREAAEGGSPMDVCSTPFTEGGGEALSELCPLYGSDGGAAPTLDQVAGWIRDALRQGGDSSSTMADVSGGSPTASSPRTSVFNQLVSAQLSPLAQPSDVQGVSKATVVRGEGDFPSSTLRILNCHDAVIYALAPLHYTLISACSDCVVVVGAVGRVVRVERCERVQVIVAAARLTINTCHDCIFYLGVNHRPTVLGDNRFLQLAPYNAGYDRLAQHMAVAGVLPSVNQWDRPRSLQPDHRKQHQEMGPAQGRGGGQEAAAAASRHQQRGAGEGGDEGPSPMVVSSSGEGGGGGPAGLSAAAEGGQDAEPAVSSPVLGTPASVTVLPPSKLLPFMVPFQGGPGPMCGGPARVSINIRASSDGMGGFMGLPEGSTTFPSSPFGLPQQYVAAWEAKMKRAAEVRAAVKTAGLDDVKKKELMSAIQSHFKDWLQQTGGMRQVYDLARMERDESSSNMMTSL